METTHNKPSAAHENEDGSQPQIVWISGLVEHVSPLRYYVEWSSGEGVKYTVKELDRLDAEGRIHDDVRRLWR